MTRLLFKTLAGLILVLLLALGAFRLAAELREDVVLGEDLPPGGELRETSEGAIFLLPEGEGREVLFAHGTAAWSGLWQPTLQAMAAKGYRATGFDMPPFGFSEHAADRDYSRTRQADRVVALLETMDRPLVVAHSVGAAPVSEAILRRPDLVSGYVIVSGAIALNSHTDPYALPLPLRSDTIRTYGTAATATNPWLTGTLLKGFLHRHNAATPEVIATLQAPLTREGYTKAVADWLPSLLASADNAQSTRPEAWAALDLPVALIWGDKDTVTPLSQAEELTALIPGATLTSLKDVGHIPQIEAPDAFRAALMDALEQLERAE